MSLGKYNVEFLWLWCAQWSLAALWSETQSDLWLSPELVMFPDMLGRFILESTATAVPYKRNAMLERDLRQVWNAAGVAVSPSIHNGDGVVPYLISLANLQFQRQTHQRLFSRLGRAYALTLGLPVRYQAEQAEYARLHGSTPDLQEMLQRHVGLDVPRIFQLGFAVIASVLERQQQLMQVPVATVQRSRVLAGRRPAAGALYLLTQLQGLTAGRLDELKFTSAHFKLVAQPEEFERFLTWTAADTRTLRAQWGGFYGRQPVDRRLSPLAVTPLVRLSNGQFTVPDFARLVLAIPDLPRFILQRHPQAAEDRGAYIQWQGHVQELYLRDLMKQRLPEATIIPELKYNVGHQQWQGADLAVVDGDGLVLVESKSTHVPVEMRVELDVEPLVAYLSKKGGAIDALLKLPTKAQHMRVGLAEFAAWQAAIEAAGQDDVYVVVYPDHYYFLTQRVMTSLQTRPDHPLNRLLGRFLIVTLEEFEILVERAASNDRSVGEVLRLEARGVAARTGQDLRWVTDDWPVQYSALYVRHWEEQVRALIADMIRRPFSS